MTSLGRTSRPPPPSSSSISLSSSTNSGIGVVSNSSHVRTSSNNSNHGVRVRSKSQSRTRSVTPNSRTRSLPDNHDTESERVRVAVRVRPRNSEELSDADYVDCVELQPELNRIKLRKNNWSSEAYRFDEVFTESASQKRVYDAVAKPVVESVLDGYNGTIMAYGQTGTGKTYTLGRLGKDDASERGIMVRSMEDILAGISASDNVEISYLQLYMESIQDLLAPEKINIPIVEDAKSGEVSVPGAEIVKIRDIDHFLQLLQLGEANRHAANTKLNSESSRSHAVLMVYVRRTAHAKKHVGINEEKDASKDRREHVPVIWKSKLLIVDLAGSERVAKSGSEGHLLEEAKFINLSLSSLGKCINALAENSPHIPTRDSKLTRLLRDSFGGSARTSLIITIGPSYSHHAETASTIMFGQRATKVVNTVKLKEEFDYESLCRKLQTQIDHLSAEIDRQQKLRENDKKETEKELEELQKSFTEAENHYVARSQLLQEENASLTSRMKVLLQDLDDQKQQNNLLLKEIVRVEESMKNKNLLEDENSRLSSELKDVQEDLKIQKNEKKIMQNEIARLKQIKQREQEDATFQRILADTTRMYEEKISDLMNQIEEANLKYCGAEEDKDRLQKQVNDIQMSMQQNQEENSGYHEALTKTTNMYEEQIKALSQQLKDEQDHARALEEVAESTQGQLREFRSSYEINAEKEIDELQTSLEEMHQMHKTVANELRLLSIQYKNLELEKETLEDEFHDMRQKLQEEERRRKEAENELNNIMKIVPESEDGFEEKKSYTYGTLSRVASALKNTQSSHRSSRSRETILSQRSTITKLCEEVGLQKIIPLLQSGDLDVQIQAVKIVANLAAEDANQEKIVQEGGLDALLMLIGSSPNATTLRVASGAIANLAMTERNQGLISNQGGAKLLANASSKTDDPQTLRMIAGAIANLCGNEKLHMVLKEDGAIKSLLGMARLGNADVTAQVARALANFAKCESRLIMKGHWRGRSLLIDGDGAALPWLVANLNNDTCASTRRHMELAFCHLAQNEDNARDLITSGGLSKLIEISDESVREDIRNLAKRTLRSSPLFRGELHADK